MLHTTLCYTTTAHLLEVGQLVAHQRVLRVGEVAALHLPQSQVHLHQALCSSSNSGSSNSSSD